MGSFERMPGPEAFKDEAFEAAVARYRPGSWVRLSATGQLVTVKEVRPSPDGPRIKTDAGSVPVEELRPATDEEVSAVMTPEEFEDYLKGKREEG